MARMLKHISSKNCLIFLLLLFILYGCAYTDDRLYGKWKSDLELSTEYNEKHAQLTDDQKALVSQLFGKLEIDYLRNGKFKSYLPEHTLVIGDKKTESDSFEETLEYKILYKNDNLAVIKSDYPFIGESVRILHFVNDDTYWIYVGDELSDMNIREYFKRIK